MRTMPTVVIPRCFLDGEHTVDEIEVCFVRRRVIDLQADVLSALPAVGRRYPRSDGSPSFTGIGMVRESDDEALGEGAVVQPADRIYLIPTIGC